MVIPPNAAKRWPKTPLTKVAGIARKEELPAMHPKSVQLYLDALTSLMKWLVAEQELRENPATGIGVAQPDASEEPRRRPLTVPEIQTLLTSGPFVPPVSQRRWRFWLPLIGLFQGMRLAEIVGLAAGDHRSATLGVKAGGLLRHIRDGSDAPTAAKMRLPAP